MDDNGTTTLLLTTNSAIVEGSTNLVSYEYQDTSVAGGLSLTVTGDVTVAQGGMINADGNGYCGGRGPVMAISTAVRRAAAAAAAVMAVMGAGVAEAARRAEGLMILSSSPPCWAVEAVPASPAATGGGRRQHQADSSEAPCAWMER